MRGKEKRPRNTTRKGFAPGSLCFGREEAAGAADLRPGASAGGKQAARGGRGWGIAPRAHCCRTSRRAFPRPWPRRGAALAWQPAGAGFSFRKATRGGLCPDASVPDASSTRARLRPDRPESQREEQSVGGPVPSFEPLTRFLLNSQPQLVAVAGLNLKFTPVAVPEAFSPPPLLLPPKPGSWWRPQCFWAATSPRPAPLRVQSPGSFHPVPAQGRVPVN